MSSWTVVYIVPVQAAPAPPSFPLSPVRQGSKRGGEQEEVGGKRIKTTQEVEVQDREVYTRREEEEVHMNYGEEDPMYSEHGEEVHKSREEQEEDDFRLALSLSQAESSTSPLRQIQNISGHSRTSPPKKQGSSSHSRTSPPQGSSRSAVFGSPAAAEEREELELAAREDEELVAREEEELAMALALSQVGTTQLI